MVFIAILVSLLAVQSADEAQLRQLIAAHQLASEHGDLRGLTDIYAADAEVISGTGNVIRGRDAIEADYRHTLASASSKSGRHHTHPPDSIQIRFLAPDLALIDVASVNVGGTDVSGASIAESRAQLLTIWRKQAGSWLVVYQRVVPATKQKLVGWRHAETHRPLSLTH